MNGTDGRSMTLFVDDGVQIEDISDQLDELNRMVVMAPENSRVIVVNGEYEVDITQTLSRDMEEPSVYFFVLQNTVLDAYFSSYCFANEPVFQDIQLPDRPVYQIYGPEEGTDTLLTEGFMDRWVEGDSLIAYSDMFRVDATGDLILKLWAQDISGNQGVEHADTFTIQNIGPEGGEFAALDGLIWIDVPEGALFEDITLLIDNAPDAPLSDVGLVCKEHIEQGLSDVFTVGTSELVFSKDVRLGIAYEGSPDARISRYTENRWEALESRIAGGRITAEITAGGLYQVRTARGCIGPPRFGLRVLSPNPMMRSEGSMSFSYSLIHESEISIDVIDVSGRRVTTLVQGVLSPGTRTERWDFDNGTGTKVAAGIYFIRMRADDLRAVEKLVILR
jgi:hypothetical protein